MNTENTSSQSFENSFEAPIGTPTPGVKEIYQIDEKTLGITWTDNISASYDVLDLRRLCPCAHCVDEHTGVRTLKAEDIKEDVRPIKIDSVGRYALKISFNDGHDTGLYTFQKLRSFASNQKLH